MGSRTGSKFCLVKKQSKLPERFSGWWTYAGAKIEGAANCNGCAEEDHRNGPVLIISLTIFTGRNFLVLLHVRERRKDERLLQIFLTSDSAIFDIFALLDGHFLLLYSLINLRMKKKKGKKKPNNVGKQ